MTTMLLPRRWYSQETPSVDGALPQEHQKRDRADTELVIGMTVSAISEASAHGRTPFSPGS